MAPKTIAEATRRSRRLASQEPEETTVVKTVEKKQRSAPVFSAAETVDQMIAAGSSRGFVNKLTKLNLAECVDEANRRNAASELEIAALKQKVAEQAALLEHTAAAASAATPSVSPVAPMRSAPSWREMLLRALPGFSPMGKRRLALLEEQDTPSKRVKVQETATELRTPRQAASLTTPRTYAGPSAKLGPEMPTSLKTISEHTEPNTTMVNFTPAPAPTPTPVLAPTPIRATPIAQRRSIKAVRAARAEREAAKTPNRRGSSWAQKPDTPREPNADRRLHKMQHLKKLEDEVQSLKTDEDIIEMRGHRRKRVKVDSLIKIPHNRPGDPSGCFRVPDIDSDDEMEVDEDCPTRQNVFEQADAVTPRAIEQNVPAIAVTPAQPAASPIPPFTSPQKISAASTPLYSQAQPPRGSATFKPSPLAQPPQGTATPPQEASPGQGQKRKHSNITSEQDQQSQLPQTSAWSEFPYVPAKRHSPEPEYSWPYVPERKTPYDDVFDQAASDEFGAGFLQWTRENGIEQYCRERGLITS